MDHTAVAGPSAAPANAPPANGNIANQRPLPDPSSASVTTALSLSSAALASAALASANTNGNQNSNSNDSASEHSSTQMQRDNSQGSNAATTPDAAMSGAESTGRSKSGRKKKSQRFYCVDFPPCSLSFTRSEHLARHIRKHTGERPFECHCLRRFSRLDNLRQHAQTVHMHEDIPIGSLAATGTRYQRQLRPEQRVGGRAVRSGSVSGPARGHSKSFSTSNIALGPGSFSAHDMRDMHDMRPRPPPLLTTDARAQHGGYQAGPDGYRPITPPEMATPTSSTFSNGQPSPHWGGRVSPSPFNSRPHSMYAATETPSRRLSVPSAESHFQVQSGYHPQRGHMHSASASGNGFGIFSSPTHAPGRPVSPDNSTVSAWSRRDSYSSTTDERRRTWHPSSRDFGGPSSARNGVPGASGPPTSASAGNVNAHYQPSGREPSYSIANPATQQSPGQGLRLPGIDTFLMRADESAASPTRRAPSPMAVDGERYAPSSGPPQSILRSPAQQYSSHQRPLSGHWDATLGIHRLDIAGQTPPQEPGRDYHHSAGYPSEGRSQQQSVRFEPEASRDDPFASRAGATYHRAHQHTMSAPAFNAPTSRQQRRQGWYNGPPGAAASRVERMVHPNLDNGFSGFPARGVPQTVHEHEHSREPSHEQERGYDNYRAAPPPAPAAQPAAPFRSGLDVLVAAAEVNTSGAPAQ